MKTWNYHNRSTREPLLLSLQNAQLCCQSSRRTNQTCLDSWVSRLLCIKYGTPLHRELKTQFPRSKRQEAAQIKAQLRIYLYNSFIITDILNVIDIWGAFWRFFCIRVLAGMLKNNDPRIALVCPTLPAYSLRFSVILQWMFIRLQNFSTASLLSITS